ncbi:hypothetical protein SAMN04488540_102294 [Ferrimonas sediminum]|uniref:Uncharacterized protein n=1 Tax=Ferrimonas sediminum TaxID=718193 RepID=A0A1G8M7W9_9GAMM|nr:hypothetical protein [Ferrimonas sediminum]SDI63927.1 hypothetical protein SAMN04488540_102294 [Ferrimonas sediminum]
MYLFIYVVILIAIGLGNKALQSFSGHYDLLSLLADLPLILFTYFGLIALWGRARHGRYLTATFWKGYFLALMVSIVVLPFVQPELQQLMTESGPLQMVLAYGVMSAIMLPYYWGLYRYAFRSPQLWQQR